MPAIRVVNPNANNKGAIIYVDLVSIVPLNEKGDNKYVFKIHTGARDVDGEGINDIFIYDTSINGFLAALPNAISSICGKIHWGTVYSDRTLPSVDYYTPSGSDVSLYTSVLIKIVDAFPSSGIDRDSIKMTVNGFDVTNDIIVNMNYNEALVSWSPKRRVING